MQKPPSIQRQFLAMDFLNLAQHPSTRPHAFKSYVSAARRTGLSLPEIAAGLRRPISFVEGILADGGV